MVRLWHQGKEQRFGGFSTKTAARQFYDKSKLEQQEGRFFPERYKRKAAAEPISKIFDDYLLTTTGKRSVQRERDFKRWWARRLKDADSTSLPAAELERARLDLLRGLRYVESETGRCVEEIGRARTHATVNRYTDWLRHVGNWAVRAKRMAENPVLALDRYPEDEAPIFHYSQDQEAALMKELDEEDVDMLRLAILSGLRQGNQFPLRKEQVNLGQGIILIPRTKNRRPRIVHLAEEGKEILRRQMARHLDSPWVFPGKRGKRPLNPRWWYNTRFRPACQRARIPVENVRQLWHALRHTFGTRLAELGYAEPAIMNAGGWDDPNAARRYMHLSDETLKAAAERLSSLKPTGTVPKTVTGDQPNEAESLQVVEKSKAAP
jgi:integrase